MNTKRLLFFAMALAAICGITHVSLASLARAMGKRVVAVARECRDLAIPFGYKASDAMTDVRVFGDTVALCDGKEMARLGFPYTAEERARFIRDTGGPGIVIANGFVIEQSAGVVIRISPPEGVVADFLIRYYRDSVMGPIRASAPHP